MKLQHLLSACSLATLLMLALFPGPCTAAFIPGNNITLESKGMIWGYEEYISGPEAVFFRKVVDLEAGNNDSFVNAWELRNIELELREKMEESIEEKPDVKLNGSSKAVRVKDVEFWLSQEGLGRVHKSSSIKNTANVTYSFEKEIGENTSLWFLGTPESEVTITLPRGFDPKKTSGMDNQSVAYENSLAVLKGKFGSEGEITLWLSENESCKAVCPYAESAESAENESKASENKTLPTSEQKTINFGVFENFLKPFCPNPKV